MLNDLSDDEKRALRVAGQPGDDHTIVDTEALYALIGKGLIYKAGPTQYVLTEAGEQAYRRLD